MQGDDNNHMTPTGKWETNHIKIKHCEIYGQSADTNIVFASQDNFHFTLLPNRFKNSFYLSSDFHLQFTSKSMGSLWYPCEFHQNSV